MSLDILYVLEVVLKERQELMPSNSYVTHLFSCGVSRILDKLGEEVAELVVASCHSKEKEIVYEAADAIFHLLVFMVWRRIRVDDVASTNLTDKNLDKMINEYSEDEMLFFTGPLDSFGKIVFLSSHESDDHKAYEAICHGSRELLCSILLLCRLHDINILTVVEELKSRMGKKRHVHGDREWIKH